MGSDHELFFAFFPTLIALSLLSFPGFFAHFVLLSLERPTLDVSLLLPFVLDAAVVIQIKESQSVGNEFSLDFEI